MFLVAPANAQFLAERLRESLGKRATVLIGDHRRATVEVMAPGVDKARAIKLALKRFGLSFEDLIAFGDGPNDVNMLASAAAGIAMDNGDPAAKRAALLKAGSNDSDTISRVIRELVITGHCRNQPVVSAVKRSGYSTWATSLDKIDGYSRATTQFIAERPMTIAAFIGMIYFALSLILSRWHPKKSVVANSVDGTVRSLPYQTAGYSNPMLPYCITLVWKTIRKTVVVVTLTVTFALGLGAVLSYLGHEPAVLFVGSGNVYNYLDGQGVAMGYSRTHRDRPTIYFVDAGSRVAEHVLATSYGHHLFPRDEIHLPILALVSVPMADNKRVTAQTVLKDIPENGKKDAAYFAMRLTDKPVPIKAFIHYKVDGPGDPAAEVVQKERFTISDVRTLLSISKTQRIMIGWGDPKVSETSRALCEAMTPSGSPADARLDSCHMIERCTALRNETLMKDSTLRDCPEEGDKRVIFGTTYSPSCTNLRQVPINGIPSIDYFVVGAIDDYDEETYVAYLDAPKCAALEKIIDSNKTRLKPAKIVYIGDARLRCMLIPLESSGGAVAIGLRHS